MINFRRSIIRRFSTNKSSMPGKSPVTEKQIARQQVLDEKVYKFGNKQFNLPYCTMRPNTDLINVKNIQTQVIDKSFELSEGFKFAYIEFLKAYARRDFRILKQLTEGRLEMAIKNEPKPCDDEIVYHLIHPTKALTQINYQLIDYNFNIGVKTDRDWNFSHNLK